MKLNSLMTLALVLCSTASTGATQESEAPGDFRVYTGEGQRATLDDIVAAMADVDIVFLGETHDDPTEHWLEHDLLARAFEAYGVTADSDAQPRKVALSLEFFQRDVQGILDEYLGDLISESTFRAASRPWPEYETDYRPLIEFAKERGLDVVAANAPRRYSSRVSRHGRESLLDLSDAARASLPPLPYGMPSAAYRAQWFQVMATVMEEEAQKCGVPIEADSTGAEPTSDHMAMANQLHTQSLWDASMAFWASDHLMRNPGELLIHMVGSFHIEYGTGIPEHVETYRPGTSRLIVSMRPVADVDVFDPSRDGENEDFVILTDESLTRSIQECQIEG
jgi:uncharacterized iron-regulated protein